jgi:aerobic-type carbon monoxide dehydrogenase small subunit (CoxS/CutS family)
LPQATDAQIVAWMNANICRCNSYPRILNAVKAAVKAGGGK